MQGANRENIIQTTQGKTCTFFEVDGGYARRLY